MPSILVTGGAGFVGSHTVITLLERQPDVKIVVVDNLSNAYIAKGQTKPESLRIIEELTDSTIEFYNVDISDKDGLSKIFENHNIECVIHFAALKAVGESVQKPLEYYQANITGTCTLFEVMRKYGVYKLVYSSSCTVYGEPEKLPINESHPTGRGLTSPYGKSKYFCEEIMKDLCTSDPKWMVVSLRYFNPVGAHKSGRIGEDPSGIPNNLMPYISQVAVGRLKELQVFGNDYPTVDGTGVRDYIHVVDLAEGHVKAVKLFHQPGFSGFHAVNLGTGTGYSVLQMIAAFESVSGRPVPYKIVSRRTGDIASNYADVSLSQRLLGWRATRTLEDMCADTWRWQSNNPSGFNNSRMPSILITGGAGFVGSHIVITLLERQPDVKIVVVDNLSNAHIAQGQTKPKSLRIIEELTDSTIEFYNVDIRDRDGLSKIFDNHNIECVIHFAALKAVGESVQKPFEYYQANITGTCILFEVMRKYGVYKLVYSSSCTVYGEPEKLPINESHPTGRGLTSPYGKSKYFCEEIMKDLCTSDPKWMVVSLRYFNPVGAHKSGRVGEDPSGIPNNLMPYISQVAVGRLKELQVFGNDYPTVDGTGVRDYIHVVDLAEGHVKAVKLFHQPGFSGFHAVNLGTGTGYSVLQMIAAFESVSGRPVPYKIVSRRTGDIASNYADVSLSQRLLGWRATRTLEDMCADTWRWQSNNPSGFNK